MTNRLASETSPYLLQHANNPVDWYPWGPEALERAAREDKPIFLSIGYAACHWCHVMERESFENPDIAALMNRDFVCIKVDREERPDLDHLYMTATVALSGSGGWPMTVFLTPDKLPFYAGTYFPPVDRWGRPGFSTLLNRINELWRAEREAVAEQAKELAKAVRERAEVSAPGELKREMFDLAAASLERSFDARFGGFGNAPKFPPCQALELLLRRFARSNDATALQMVTKTLDGMKDGGIYDHLGGGFARYSVDARWHVPHFEKMLYDNAGLAKLYLSAYQATGNEEYARVVRETLDFTIREMQGAEGGYYSAFDADSEGVEGKYYVWSRDELDTILDRESAERFALFYDVTNEGNWEGTNVLRRLTTLDAVAKEFGIAADDLWRSLAESRSKLLVVRGQRVPPLLDDKTLTAWNGLMIDAMAEAARVFGEARYLDSAKRSANYLTSVMRRPDGGLFRTARQGRANLEGYLEDYAYLSDALITLYEASADEVFLGSALELAERMLLDFGDDENGALYFTAKNHEALLARSREGDDGAIPNPNSIAARALLRLAVHFDRADLEDRAKKLLSFYGALVERAPRAFAALLNAAEFSFSGGVELVVVGSPGEPGRNAIEAALRAPYLPDRVIAYVDPDRGDTPRPLTQGKALVEGRAALYVCRDFVCKAPITDASEVANALSVELTRSAAFTHH